MVSRPTRYMENASMTNQDTPEHMLDDIQYMEYKMNANPNATNSELDAKVIIDHRLKDDYDPEPDLIAELLQITAELGGTMTRQDTLNSQGVSSKRIVIEYAVTKRDKTAPQEIETDKERSQE